MDLMFFLRGPGDDGDSDIGEDGSCFQHAYYMPSTALGPCLATKQKSNYKHHLTNGNPKAQSRDKQKTNKQKLTVVYTQSNKHCFLFPATFWQIQFTSSWFPVAEPQMYWEAQNDGGGREGSISNHETWIESEYIKSCAGDVG